MTSRRTSWRRPCRRPENWRHDARPGRVAPSLPGLPRTRRPPPHPAGLAPARRGRTPERPRVWIERSTATRSGTATHVARKGVTGVTSPLDLLDEVTAEQPEMAVAAPTELAR